MLGPCRALSIPTKLPHKSLSLTLKGKGVMLIKMLRQQSTTKIPSKLGLSQVNQDPRLSNYCPTINPNSCSYSKKLLTFENVSLYN